jgi:hypothetical protein
VPPQQLQDEGYLIASADHDKRNLPQHSAPTSSSVTTIIDAPTNTSLSETLPSISHHGPKGRRSSGIEQMRLVAQASLQGRPWREAVIASRLRTDARIKASQQRLSHKRINNSRSAATSADSVSAQNILTPSVIMMGGLETAPAYDLQRLSSTPRSAGRVLCTFRSASERSRLRDCTTLTVGAPMVVRGGARGGDLPPDYPLPTATADGSATSWDETLMLNSDVRVSRFSCHGSHADSEVSEYDLPRQTNLGTGLNQELFNTYPDEAVQRSPSAKHRSPLQRVHGLPQCISLSSHNMNGCPAPGGTFVSGLSGSSVLWDAAHYSRVLPA